MKLMINKILLLCLTLMLSSCDIINENQNKEDKETDEEPKVLYDLTATAVTEIGCSLVWNTRVTEINYDTMYAIFAKSKDDREYTFAAVSYLNITEVISLIPETQYLIKVAIYNRRTNELSDYSNPISVRTKKGTLPKINKNVLLTNSSSHYKFTWDEIEDAESYVLYKSDNINGPFIRYYETSRTDNDSGMLEPNSFEYYKIQAVNETSKKSSLLSDVIIANSKTAELQTPVIKNANATSYQIFVEWESLDDSYYYDYQIYESPKEDSLFLSSDYSSYFKRKKNLFLIVRDVLPLNKEYIVEIRAYEKEYGRNNQKSSHTAAINITTGNTRTLQSPSNLKVLNPKHREIEISWDPVEDADIYYIFCSDYYDDDYSYLKEAQSTSCIIDEKFYQREIYFKVMAIDESGKNSSKLSELPVGVNIRDSLFDDFR